MWKVEAKRPEFLILTLPSISWVILDDSLTSTGLHVLIYKLIKELIAPNADRL